MEVNQNVMARAIEKVVRSDHRDMEINPDRIVLFRLGPVPISATLVSTWLVMALLLLASILATWRLRPTLKPTLWQSFIEALIELIRNQIGETTRQDPDELLPFVGTLFLFIATSNLLGELLPGFHPPTASLSTTTALALLVFFAVPYYGVKTVGPVRYLRHYLEPHPLILPFHIIGEFSRTLALAFRLYGNILGGGIIGAVILLLVPFLLPVLFQLFELLIGLIQAYIFAMLALVYIASARTAQEEHLLGGPGGGSESDSTREKR